MQFDVVMKWVSEQVRWKLSVPSQCQRQVARTSNESYSYHTTPLNLEIYRGDYYSTVALQIGIESSSRGW